MMKRCISALLLLTLLLTLCACAEKEKALAVSVGELSDKVADAMASEQTAEYDETMLLDELGMLHVQHAKLQKRYVSILLNGRVVGKVDELDLFVAVFEITGLLVDRDAGPVAHALARTSQGIEKRGLAAVRIADHADDMLTHRL